MPHIYIIGEHHFKDAKIREKIKNHVQYHPETALLFLEGLDQFEVLYAVTKTPKVAAIRGLESQLLRLHTDLFASLYCTTGYNILSQSIMETIQHIEYLCKQSHFSKYQDVLSLYYSMTKNKSILINKADTLTLLKFITQQIKQSKIFISTHSDALNFDLLKQYKTFSDKRQREIFHAYLTDLKDFWSAKIIHDYVNELKNKNIFVIVGRAHVKGIAHTLSTYFQIPATTIIKTSAQLFMDYFLPQIIPPYVSPSNKTPSQGVYYPTPIPPPHPYNSQRTNSFWQTPPTASQSPTSYASDNRGHYRITR